MITEEKKKKILQEQIKYEKKELDKDIVDLKEYENQYQNEITMNQRICQELLKVQELTLKITEQLNLLKIEIRVIEKENLGLIKRIIKIKKQITIQQNLLVKKPENILRLKEKTNKDLKNIKKLFLEEELKSLHLNGKLHVIEKSSNRLKQIEWLSWRPILKIFSQVDKLRKKIKERRWSIVQILNQIKSKRKIINQQKHFFKKTQIYLKLKQKDNKNKIRFMLFQKQKIQKKLRGLDVELNKMSLKINNLKWTKKMKLDMFLKLKKEKKHKCKVLKNLMKKYQEKKQIYLNEKHVIEFYL